MNPQYIDLFEHEARALADKRLGVVIRIMDPQPIRINSAQYTWNDELANIHGDPARFWIGPFIPGTVLLCREDYGHSWHHAQPRCFYKSTDFDKVDCHPDFDGWMKAGSMPNGFIRHRVTVGGVKCARVQDVTCAQWGEWGCYDIIHPLKNHPLREAAYAIGHWEPYGDDEGEGEMFAGLVEAGYTLFNSIHGPGSWEENPWLWLATIKPTE